MKLFACLRTLRAYSKTPKGAFDTRDFARAALLIGASVALAVVFLKSISLQPSP